MVYTHLNRVQSTKKLIDHLVLVLTQPKTHHRETHRATDSVLSLNEHLYLLLLRRDPDNTKFLAKLQIYQTTLRPVQRPSHMFEENNKRVTS